MDGLPFFFPGKRLFNPFLFFLGGRGVQMEKSLEFSFTGLSLPSRRYLAEFFLPPFTLFFALTWLLFR